MDKMNNSTAIALRTSDIGAGYHHCSPDISYGCTVDDDQRSIPKNIGNILCLPSSTFFTVTDSCMSLLNSGSSQDCQKNSAKGFCSNGVAPTCNYRTSADADTKAQWNWVVNYTGTDAVSVDCNENGYQGYTE
ncbi:hypothetical protein [Roseibium sediminicola]|uniref:Uncharacterized protein n=1 Tax=Roseibium sediminicola TaxID=2933272 RepID=A0ABT0GX34_9HYPH|nr:hypothetical protein [Roseibium sp. CAU 1639]MCK7613800.1 hypothetical protein [Roseibium sp. CAU 1639]